MFLVEKTKNNHHFKSLTKKPPQIIPPNKLLAQSFDDVIISHLRTLTLSSNSITLSWMSRAVTFLTTIHTAAYNQIVHSFRSGKFFESDLMTSYMDYSLKVLELCNLMTSSVKEMTERKMLMKLALRLTKSGDVAPEKMKKAKEVLSRCVECTRARGDEKSSRAKVLIGELISGACKLPVGEVSNEAGVVRRTLHALGALTVVISNVLLSVLYGQSEMKEHRVSNEFSWANSVNSVQKQLVDQVKAKCLVSDIEDTNRLAVNVCDVIDDVMSNGNEEQRVRLEKVVKEYEERVVRYCDGVDELTNGVNGLFNGVMKTRNGVLDGVRKGSSW